MRVAVAVVAELDVGRRFHDAHQALHGSGAAPAGTRVATAVARPGAAGLPVQVPEQVAGGADTPCTVSRTLSASIPTRYPRKRRENARVLTVIGNRPQFIKAAAVSGPLRAVADEVLVHTGQHYDEALSQVFFDELGLPRPEHRLELGGGSNTAQTARMLAALEPLLAAERPALVLVYGDTNSTLAGALAAAQAGHPGRPRRGRHALVRPHDAGGAQPRAHRPRERPAAVLVAGAGGHPARRARRRARSRSSAT